LWLVTACLTFSVAWAETPSGRSDGAEVQPPVFDIARATEPIVIDGVLDEPTWQRASVFDVSFKASAVGRRDAHAPMRVRYAWDEHYLYIAYEVRDTDLRAISDGRIVGPPNNQRAAVLSWAPEQEVDVAEFFITLGSRRIMWEIQQNALNHRNETMVMLIDRDDPLWNSVANTLGVLLLRHEYVEDDGPYTSRSAVRLLVDEQGQVSTPNHPEDVDVGYVGEIRLPWLSLAPPTAARTGRQGVWNMEGRELRMLAVYLNGNDGEPVYHHDSPTRPRRGMFAQAVDHFPRYRLVTVTEKADP